MWKPILTLASAAVFAVLTVLIAPQEALAQDAKLSSGDTAWIITSTALVLFMTLPGLALFYGGLVRARNLLSVLMHCFAVACLMSILWFVLVYSLAFSNGGAANPWIGGLSKAFLSGVGKDTLFGTIPESVFFMFQMTFAVITPALIIGAYVDVSSSARFCGSARCGWCLSMRRFVTGSGAVAGSRIAASRISPVGW